MDISGGCIGDIVLVLFSLGYSQYMSNWRFNFSHQELGWLKFNIFLRIAWDNISHQQYDMGFSFCQVGGFTLNPQDI